MSKYIKLEGFALDVAEKWAEYRTEKAMQGSDLKEFDRRMKMQVVIGLSGMDIAEEIIEAAKEISDIQIQASEWAEQRKEAISVGLPMDAYDHSMRKGIFFGNLDEEKTEEIFRLAVELSESKTDDAKEPANGKNKAFAVKWARERKIALSKGVPEDVFDRRLFKYITLDAITAEEAQAAIDLVKKLSESEDFK